jgi:hypothetical protein
MLRREGTLPLPSRERTEVRGLSAAVLMEGCAPSHPQGLKAGGAIESERRDSCHGPTQMTTDKKPGTGHLAIPVRVCPCASVAKTPSAEHFFRLSFPSRPSSPSDCNPCRYPPLLQTVLSGSLTSRQDKRQME